MSNIIEDQTIVLDSNSQRPASQFQISPYYKEFVDIIMISDQEIDQRLNALALQIVEYYRERPFIMIITMKGALTFFNKLRDKMTKLYVERGIKNFIQDEYLRVKSYHNTQSTGQIQFEYFSYKFEDLKNQEVLLLEDIYDTGLTLSSVYEKLQTYGPKDLKCCVFLNIKSKHLFEIPCQFVAFDGPSFFYIGYGMDYNEKFRDFPHLGILNEKGKEDLKH